MPDSTRIRSLQQDDLRWLVCPVCRESLALDADFVICKGCDRRYPVLAGIPILLADRAS